MGLPSDVLAYIRKEFPSAFLEGHPPQCDVVVNDAMTDIHPLIRTVFLRHLTVSEIYNIWFRSYRADLARGSGDVVIPLDAGVPLLKKDTVDKRAMARSASDARAEQKQQRSQAAKGEIKQISLKEEPYHEDSVFLANGTLSEPSKDPRGLPTLHRRILMSRLWPVYSLRRKFLEYCVTRCMPKEDIPYGARLWVDYTMNRQLGPVVFEAGQSPQIEGIRATHANDWLEADWKIPFWLRIGLPEYKTAMVYSLDGDMVPILLWMYDRLYAEGRSVRVEGEKVPTIYWYNGRDDSKVLDIKALHGALIQSGWPIPAFVGAVVLSGTDYCPKSKLTHRIGAEKLFSAIKRGTSNSLFASNDYKATSKDGVDVPAGAPPYFKSKEWFRYFIGRVYSLAGVKRPSGVSDEELETARERVCAGWLAWDQCWRAQRSSNRWLRPIGSPSTSSGGSGGSSASSSASTEEHPIDSHKAHHFSGMQITVMDLSTDDGGDNKIESNDDVVMTSVN